MKMINKINKQIMTMNQFFKILKTFIKYNSLKRNKFRKLAFNNITTKKMTFIIIKINRICFKMLK